MIQKQLRHADASNRSVHSKPGISAFETLAFACRRDPVRPRLTFLNAEGEAETVRGGDLIARAQTLGRYLRTLRPPGERVMLAFPAGIDFIIAFLAAVQADLIPVPVPYPKPRRPMSRYQSIVDDCGATLGITDDATRQRIQTESAATFRWISPVAPVESPVESPAESPADCDGSMERQWGQERPRGHSDGPLFLQYTSGSTSQPKGVQVTLKSLLANLQVIGRGFQLDDLEPADRVVCSWLPAYHDMGLVGVILSTLIHDGHAVLMSPQSFLQTPSRWLRAISDYRAAITVAPSFGYRWAATKISQAETADLDLSCLSVAACGAEPIDPEVLSMFADRFEPQGFDRDAFYPCYGLAECTLMVTGADRESMPGATTTTISRCGLRSDQAIAPQTDADAMTVVSCGRPGHRTEVRIVDPVPPMTLMENRIGEIWVHSPSVAAGYWNQPVVSEKTFAATLSNDDQTWLRTGDLGFLRDGELYITGRLKDLMIIRGQNHYPQDIERSVCAADPALADSPGAAFVVTPASDSPSSVSTEAARMVVVQEVPRSFDAERSADVLDAIRLAIAAEHDLLASEIILIRAASMPRTSSGKTRRFEAREHYIAGELKVVDRWQAVSRLDPAQFPDLQPCLSDPNAWQIVRDRIERVLVGWLIRQTGGNRDTINAELPFAECGIDSLTAVEMSSQIQQWLGVEVSPVVAWSYPNANKLSSYLADQYVGPRAAEVIQADTSIESLLSEIEAMDDVQATAALRAVSGGKPESTE